MDGKRVIASLVNWLGTILIVNIVLWIINKPLLGEMWFGVDLPKGRLNLLVFALLTLLIFGLVIGWIVNVVFWAQGKESIPTILYTKLMVK